VFFDLFYPGHYRRRIKSVRLSIPCVTGPYTNVPATLSLTDSWIRRDPRLGATSLVAVLPRRSISVATSTGQNDAGVFEFSFRDERCMPFEGAGAVSDWRLELPKNFALRLPDHYRCDPARQLHSRSRRALRTQVEQANAGLDGTIMQLPHQQRDRPAVQHAAGVLHRTQSTDEQHDGNGRQVACSPNDTSRSSSGAEHHCHGSQASSPHQDRAVGRHRLTAQHGAAVGGFVPDTELGNLPAADVTTAFADGLTSEHTLTLTNAGDLSPDSPQPGDPTSLDPEKLTDILLHLELRLV
jgi:hypothetical protein